MEIQVRGSLNKESEIMGGLSFELYERYAHRTDKAAMFLSKQFLSRILDAYYYEPHDNLAEYDHVIYSDSDGKKVIMLRYDTDTYKVTVRKRDIPDIINYLRDNYSFFYDPNRKQLEDDVKWLSLKVEELEDDAETDNVKWRPYIADILGMDKGSDWSDICIRARVTRHDKDNVGHCLRFLEKAVEEAYTEVFPADARDKYWFAYHRQAITDIVEALKRERALKETAEEKAIQWKASYQDLKKKVLDTYQTLYPDDFQPGDPMKALELISDYIPMRSKAVCKGLNEEFERANKLEQKLMALYDVLGVVPKEDI